MALFLDSDELNAKLIKLIREADQFLYLVSPYVKFHTRVWDELKAKKQQSGLRIVVVYGKNIEDPSLSMGDAQFDFLTSFPNIRILYSERLHAKVYASEDAALITSLNLYEYSINNNIEAGVMLLSPHANHKHRDFGDAPDEKAYAEAIEFVEKIVIARADVEYESEKQSKKANQYQGYCIRTGKPIPFNPDQPMSYKAWQTWAQFSNPDYPEQYCHKTGKPSNGKTSMRRPVLDR